MSPRLSKAKCPFGRAERSLVFSLSALETEKICSGFGIRISHNTVLRLVYHIEVEMGTSPFVGIDDFAFKKGHSYGAIGYRGNDRLL